MLNFHSIRARAIRLMGDKCKSRSLQIYLVHLTKTTDFSTIFRFYLSILHFRFVSCLFDFLYCHCKIRRVVNFSVDKRGKLASPTSQMQIHKFASQTHFNWTINKNWSDSNVAIAHSVNRIQIVENAILFRILPANGGVSISMSMFKFVGLFVI